VSQPPRRRIPLLGWIGAALLAVTLAAVSLGLHSPGAGAIDDGQSGSPRRVVTFGFVDTPDGPTPVYPPVAGRVVAVHVKENDVVRKDLTKLLSVDDRQAKEKVAQAQAELAAARQQLKQAEGLVEKHKAAVEAQKAKALAKHAEADAADTLLPELKRHYESKNLSKEKYEAAGKEAVARRKAAEAEDAYTAVLETEHPEWAVGQAKENVTAKEAQEREAQVGLDLCTVKAPGDGSVLRVNVTAGQVYGPSAPHPAMIFCPAGPRIVRAEVDQEWAGRVFVGQKSTVQDDARNGSEWTGKVTRLSDWFAHRRSMVLEPLQFNDIRTLEAIIELDGDANLRIGQRMRVTLEPGE
jgi:multidrug resistance efflux pump